MTIRPRTILSVVALFLAAAPTAAHADFGIAPGSLTVTALSKNDGTLDTQAGSHPFSYTVHFAMNTDETNEKGEGGALRDVVFEVPAGLIGNPAAVPTCRRADFDGGTPTCPPGTQIGVIHAIGPSVSEIVAPLYNLEPPPGTPVLFGIDNSAGLYSLQSATLRTEPGEEEGEPYGVNIIAPNIPIELTSVTATIWGTPADPEHTKEREGRTAPPPLLPFLTLPTSCLSPPRFTVKVDSTENPGVFVHESSEMLDAGGRPATLSGCEAVPFSPAVGARPTSAAADSSAGLDFQLALPNQGLFNPLAVSSETEPVRTEVTLPEGVIVNPAAASGLAACSKAQFRSASLSDPGCPEASKVGTLLVNTPLLQEPVEGSFYLATPHQNRFNSLIALYIVARAPVQGILIKQAGEVKIDPQSGRLTAIFDGLPPIPYSSFRAHLREGARGVLITPQTCGTYTTVARLYPFSNPNVPTERDASFTIGSGANGGSCASNEAVLPNNPTLQAGTVSPVAGAFSPFVFKVSREDGTQSFGSIIASLPEGLLGKLAGVPYCSEAQIAAASGRSNEGEGAAERSSPSCPEASQVGVVNITAGAGSQPIGVQGKAYLAGPYKDAPLSLAIITPAIAGPFDLGTVVVRVALYIDRSTAQIRAVSDPIPRSSTVFPSTCARSRCT